MFGRGLICGTSVSWSMRGVGGGTGAELRGQFTSWLEEVLEVG
jgi:hypothetical protein